MSVPTQTYTFISGAVPTAAQWNSNFITIFAAFANIDQTNIGANGILASQIKPSGTAGATFGGSIPYTFTTALTVLSGYVSPVYTTTGGAAASSTQHETGIGVASTVSIANGASSGSTLVTLSGNGTFTSTSSYTVFVTIEGTATCSTSAATVPVVASVTNVSASSFTLYVYTANGLTNNSGSTQSYIVNWRCHGT